MFKSFTAWFSPELVEEYKGTWIRNGGQLKELAEADIAFVSDRTTSPDDSHKPSMIILRPDWIEDSSSQDSDLAVGIAAYESTRVLALAPPSIPAYQPEAEVQDLSLTESGPATPAPRRRSLPKTIKRTKKRAAKTADPQSYEGFFGSTDSEEDDLSRDTVSPPALRRKRRRARYEEDCRAQEDKLDAASYLANIFSELDKESKKLLSGSNAQLRLIDIASTDIALRARKGR